MSIFIKTKLIYWGCTAAVLLTSCLPSNNEVSGGDGLETGNALSGIVVDKNGGKADGATVRLFPVDYDAASGESLPEEWTQITNDEGEFKFTSVSTGNYNIMAVSENENTHVLMQDINLTDTEDVPNTEYRVPSLQLQTPTAVSVKLNGLVSSPRGYLYIPGTSITGDINDSHIESGSFRFAGLPRGIYQRLLYKTESVADPVNILLVDLPVITPGEVSVSPYGMWNFSRSLTLNTTPDGANTDTRVLDFPILVHLTSENFDFTQSNASGQDIRFLKKNQLPLDYQVEKWDAAGKEALVWIKLDTLAQNSRTEYFDMFWGNSFSTPQQNSATSLFESLNGYVGVYHLGEKSIPLDNIFSDASDNGNNMVAVGVFDAGNLIAGNTNGGLSLNGIDQYLYSAKEYNQPYVFTLSLWFRTTTTSGGKLIGFGTHQQGGSKWWDRHIYMSDDGTLNFGVFPYAGQVAQEDSTFLGIGDTTRLDTLQFPGIRRIISTPASYNDGQWHHVVAGLSPDGMTLFMDGELIRHWPEVTRAQAFKGYWRIGYDQLATWEYRGSSEYFMGDLDEVQILHEARPADWVRMMYHNQKAGGNVYEFGDVNERH